MNQYDVLVIGAGPAGLTAAMYAARSRLRTAIVDKLGAGGYLNMITLLENYPGFPAGVTGSELADLMSRQLATYEVAVQIAEVIRLSPRAPAGYEVTFNGAEDCATQAVIIATGSKPRQLGVPGEQRLIGKGVSYCAVCDGPLFRDKDVVVVGGGNAALEEALHLARYCRRVTLVHRRAAFRADRVIQEKVMAQERIRILTSHVCLEICGEDKVRGVRLRQEDRKEQEIACQGVFVCIGMDPVTDFLPSEIGRDSQGFIRTAEDLSCSWPGVFACGDCRASLLRQVVTACGEGALAAFSARKMLEEQAAAADNA